MDLARFLPEHGNASTHSCTMYGECGRKSIFSGPYNCYTPNTPPQAPPSNISRLLARVCGPVYGSGRHVCCDAAQVETLATSLHTVENLVGACPACLQNLRTLWCDFACSPNQGSFVNVSKKGQLPDKTGGSSEVVEEAQYYVADSFAQVLYDSCKDVKFGPDSRLVMEFIGGDAKSPREFLNFMGKPHPAVGGSPMTVKFPAPAQHRDDMGALFSVHSPPSVACNTTNPSARCACIDCESVCPALPPASHHPNEWPFSRYMRSTRTCTIGPWTCLAFAGAILEAVLLLSWTVFIFYRLWRYRRYSRLAQSSEFLPLGGEEAIRGAGSSSANSATFHEGDESEEEGVGLASKRRMGGITSADTSMASGAAIPPGDVTGFASLRESEMALPPNLSRRWLPSILLRMAYACARAPKTTMVVALAVCAFLSAGWLIYPLRIVTDPVGLWVSPRSQAAASKSYYDQHFGPFYRIQQVIISTRDPSRSIIEEGYLKFIFAVQSRIEHLTVTVDETGWGGPGGRAEPPVSGEGTRTEVTLKDLCLRPLRDGGCVIESVLGYFQDDESWLSRPDWREHLDLCLNHPAQYECLPTFKRALEPEHVLNSKMNSTAAVLTFVNRNKETDYSAFIRRSEAWEGALRNYLDSLASGRELIPSDLRVSYSTESSIESEVRTATRADYLTILFSYVAMLIYIIVQLRNVSLGIMGVLVVLLSVSMSLGFMAWIQWPVNFVVLEVIPFLALAVGVDNAFLLVDGYHQVAVFRSVPHRVALAVAEKGPGCFVSLALEFLIFLTAASIPIPVVSDFAMCAAITVLCLFFLQFTLYVAVLSMSFVPEMKYRASLWRSYLDHLATWRGPILASFAITAFVGLCWFSNIRLGLDQRAALPPNSHLTSYFNDIDEYYHVGPPVYFMVSNVSLSRMEDVEALCSKFTQCSNVSIPNLLEQERKRSKYSHLASPVTTWLDDFLMWLRPEEEADATRASHGLLAIQRARPSCCSLRRAKLPVTEFCTEADPASECVPCVAPKDWKRTDLPQIVNAIRPRLGPLLRHWLQEPPTENCPLAGASAYGDAVDEVTLDTFAYRVYSTPMHTQSNYISAYRITTEGVLRELQEHHPHLNIQVYSPFHVFFAQYPDLPATTAKLILLALVEVAIVALIALVSFRAALVLTLAMSFFTWLTLTMLFGFACVPFNAVSVANLIMGIGLGVEFCAHIIKSYDENLTANTTTISRVNDTMFLTGKTVLNGIGWTKLVGIAVLAFARASFFRVYFFLMYLGILVVGLTMAFGLVPVLLYYMGKKVSIPPSI